MALEVKITVDYHDIDFAKEIRESIESSPELRAEMRRAFHQANRRIQNIRNANLFSPAVAALGNVEGAVSEYTQFSMSGDWETLKARYGQVMAFLNDETSTATAARRAKKGLQHVTGLDNEPELFEKLYSQLNTLTGELGAEAPDLPHGTDVTFAQAAAAIREESIHSMIENARAISEDLQNQVDRVAEHLSKQANEGLRNIFR